MQNKKKHNRRILFKNGLDTMKISSSRQQYDCEICDNEFLSPVQLTIHCIIEHNLNPCNECLKLFGNENQLKQHKQSSCHNKNQTCRICSIIFLDETSINEHMTQEHSQRKCNLCTAVISNEYESQHLHYFHRARKLTSAVELKNSNQFTCYFCDKDLNTDKLISHYIFIHKCSIDSLIRIIFESYGKAILPLELLKTDCSGCKLHCANDEFILRKIGSTSNDRRKDYSERQPDQTYYSEIQRTQNFNCDKKIISFDTKMVKYVYSTESDYDSPEDTDEWCARLIKLRRCDFCRFSSKSKYVIAQHLHRKHGFILKNSKFDCDPCKKTFTINRNLQKHNKMVHHKQISSNDKRYKCSFCNYASNCKQKMRNHIRDHVESSYHPCNDRAIGFNCKYCHFIFWTRDKLSDHLLNRHSENVNESYLLCYICVGTFTNLATFRQHFAFRHFDDRQPGTGVFQCSICRLAYPSIESIRCHMNEAHPMLQARYCGAESCMQLIGDDHELNSHWSDKHNTNSTNSNTLFQCTKCLKLFENQEFVLKHWHQSHSNEKKMK